MKIMILKIIVKTVKYITAKHSMEIIALSVENTYQTNLNKRKK